LVTLAVLFVIDQIVNGTLYSYGLQFSYNWAIGYWNVLRLGFAVSWFVIITTITLHLYLSRKTKETVEEQREMEQTSEEPWVGEREETVPRREEPSCTYTLSDGSTIKVKHKLKSAKRLEKYSPEGIPIYVVDYDNIVQVVSVPEKLTKKFRESSI
jgi:membrane protein implicated in regulation of membrane protease activity